MDLYLSYSAFIRGGKMIDTCYACGCISVLERKDTEFLCSECSKIGKPKLGYMPIWMNKEFHPRSNKVVN